MERKAVIVIERPESCFFCQLSQIGFTPWCGATHEEATRNGFPENCPLIALEKFNEAALKKKEQTRLFYQEGAHL